MFLANFANMKKTRILTFSVIGLFFIFIETACSKKKPMDESDILADVDRHYSAISAEKGRNAAFLAMFDTACVVLRSNRMPIVGYKANEELLMGENDSSYSLTWEPLFAKIAKAGDMGYTYGTYKVTDKVSDSLTGEGTYLTIWQKKEDGTWKALLDTGNDGLGNKR